MIFDLVALTIEMELVIAMIKEERDGPSVVVLGGQATAIGG